MSIRLLRLAIDYVVGIVYQTTIGNELFANKTKEINFILILFEIIKRLSSVHRRSIWMWIVCLSSPNGLWENLWERCWMAGHVYRRNTRGNHKMIRQFCIKLKMHSNSCAWIVDSMNGVWRECRLLFINVTHAECKFIVCYTFLGTVLRWATHNFMIGDRWSQMTLTSDILLNQVEFDFMRFLLAQNELQNILFCDENTSTDLLLTTLTFHHISFAVAVNGTVYFCIAKK